MRNNSDTIRGIFLFVFLISLAAPIMADGGWYNQVSGFNIYLYENQNLTFVLPYLYETAGNVFFNESKMNETIITLSATAGTDFTNLQNYTADGCYGFDRAIGRQQNGTWICNETTSSGGDNSSWNQSHADGIYYQSGDTTSLGTSNFTDNLYHTGDPNTYIAFVPDQIVLYAGGINFLQVTESTIDTIMLNGANSAVDTTIGATGHSDALQVNGTNAEITLGYYSTCNLETDATGLLICGTDDTSSINLPINTTNVSLESLNGVLYNDMQDYLNIIQSAGKISGADFEDNSDGTINVTAGTGFIKIASAFDSTNAIFNWSQNTSVELTDQVTTYIYIDYNSGSPLLKTTVTKSDANNRDKILLGKVFREGTKVHLFSAGMYITELARSTLMFFTQVFGEAVRASGAVIGEEPNRNISLTEGVMFGGLTRKTIAAKSTVTGDDFEYYYYNSTDWLEYTDTSINNTMYNDVASGLSELTVNRYGVHWVYVCNDGDILIVYGQGDYTLSNAELAQPPSSLPEHVSGFSFLASKIIIQKGESSFTAIQSAYDTQFNPAKATDHGELTGLTDDDHDGIYYTETEVDNLVAGATGNTSWNQSFASTLFINATGQFVNDQICYYDGLNGWVDCNLDQDTFIQSFDDIVSAYEEDAFCYYNGAELSCQDLEIGTYSDGGWCKTSNDGDNKQLDCNYAIAEDDTNWNKTYADTLYADITVTNTRHIINTTVFYNASGELGLNNDYFNVTEWDAVWQSWKVNQSRWNNVSDNGESDDTPDDDSEVPDDITVNSTNVIQTSKGFIANTTIYNNTGIFWSDDSYLINNGTHIVLYKS